MEVSGHADFFFLFFFFFFFSSSFLLDAQFVLFFCFTDNCRLYYEIGEEAAKYRKHGKSNAEVVHLVMDNFGFVDEVGDLALPLFLLSAPHPSVRRLSPLYPALRELQ